MLTTQTNKTDALLSDWLHSGRRASAHTVEAYSRDVRQFLKHCGDKALAEVTAGDVAKFQRHLRDKWQPATEYRKLAAVRSFFAFLQAAGEVREDVASLISAPKVESNFRERALTVDEVKALIEAARLTPINALLIRMLYLTGARVSEVLSLTWAHLKADDEGGGMARILGKGRKKRDAYIGAELWADVVALRGEAEDKEPLFVMNRFQVWQLVKHLARAAQISGDVSPHSLRHAHATHALEAGATLAEIRDQLGHADIKITSLYLQSDPERSTAKRLAIK